MPSDPCSVRIGSINPNEILTLLRLASSAIHTAPDPLMEKNDSVRGRPAPVRTHVRYPLLILVLSFAGATPLHGQATGWGISDGLMPRFEYLSRLAGQLLIPVQGISAEKLRDSYTEGRSGGRVHAAIDIHAPRGTPVVAVADGTILKLHRQGNGGNSIFHLDADGRTRYYYAHLDRYAESLREGSRVRRGEVIGYVGDTGNAAKGDYHLHFSIAILSDLARWWEGENVNPYPVLTGKLGSR